MSAVHIVALGDGELVHIANTTIEIIEDGSRTGHRLGVARSTLPAKTPGPPQHRHREHDEGFFVTRGKLVFTVGSDTHEVPTGTFVMVPIGEPHTFANPFDEDAEFITTFTPDFYVQYFRDIEALATGSGLTVEGVKALMERYATEPVSSEPLA